MICFKTYCGLGGVDLFTKVMGKYIRELETKPQNMRTLKTDLLVEEARKIKGICRKSTRFERKQDREVNIKGKAEFLRVEKSVLLNHPKSVLLLDHLPLTSL